MRTRNKKKHISRAKFQSTILSWYRKHKRDLPWRKITDPYHILVSEVMLQQTQVDRVIPKYFEFLERFPTLTALARAPLREILRVWSGLGYNRRALYLRKCSQQILVEHKGQFPNDPRILVKLPGIGQYTAAAIASFAWNQDVPLADTNISRIFSRVFFGVKEPSAKELRQLAIKLLPKGKARIWPHALMDFGALICRSRPRCQICPLQKSCQAYPEILTPKPRRTKTIPFHQSVRFYRGQLLKILQHIPAEKAVSLKYLEKKFPKSPSHIDLEQISFTLAKDGLVKVFTKRNQLYLTLP